MAVVPTRTCKFDISIHGARCCPHAFAAPCFFHAVSPLSRVRALHYGRAWSDFPQSAAALQCLHAWSRCRRCRHANDYDCESESTGMESDLLRVHGSTAAECAGRAHRRAVQGGCGHFAKRPPRPTLGPTTRRRVDRQTDQTYRADRQRDRRTRPTGQTDRQSRSRTRRGKTKAYRGNLPMRLDREEFRVISVRFRMGVSPSMLEEGR